ncbi:putative bacteriotail tape measure protein [Edwardsiella phage eiAU-183]|uniref:Tape measure protein n=2 Tax=Eiauvirus eiAU TaxID=1982112 RepID=W0LLZ7_9CAUD|nr:tail length tape measure protein [Edwardsiella phage eiAU-183]YP_009613851.1 tail length tape measure protein [Edwardsiella phage eiAU]AHG23417.1 putative bacteriotail tape measure protein [Edwardsiella phage eiAU]AHG23471.1 putative bacteriotail tape measure protein [Edwardsiella phage eiAU-183]
MQITEHACALISGYNIGNITGGRIMTQEIASISLRADVGSVSKASTELDKLTVAAEKAERANDKLGDAAKKAGSGVAGAGAAAGSAATALEKNSAATERAAKAQQRQIELADKFGMSQKQLTATMRGVPAQITDIVTSLQGGQRPLTVLIQQGGQLRDMFGGIGNALRALASTIGPVGLSIAAVGATLATIGAGVTNADRQISSLNKTLNMTSHFSGLTANEILKLGESAERSGGSFRGTVSAVQKLAAAGVSANADFSALGKSVQAFAKASGQSLDDVIGQVAKLSTDPVGGLRALQTQYKAVTEEQIIRVQKLIDEGQQTRAIAEANRIASASFTDLAANVTGQLGMVELAMMSIRNAAKNMWDAILDIGRPESVGVQLAAAEKVYTAYKKRWELEKDSKVVTEAGKAALYDQMETARRQVETLRQQTQAENKKAAATKAAAQEQQKQNVLNATAASEAEKFATNTQKQNREIDTQKRLLDANLISLAEYNRRVEEIRKKYEEKPVRAKAVKVDAGVRVDEQSAAQLRALEAQIALMKQRDTYDRNASQQRRALLLFEAEHSVLVEASQKRQLTLAEKQIMASYEQIRASKVQLADAGDQLLVLQRQAEAHDNVSKAVAETDAQMQALAATYGMSTKEAKRFNDEAVTRATLAAQGATTADIEKALDAKRKLWAEQDIAEQDWQAGAIRGLKDWADASTNYSAIAGQAVEDAMNRGVKAVSDFVTSGKMDFKSFTADVLKMIADIITQLLVMQGIKSAANALGLGGLFANAKGGVYSGGDLSRYSGQVVNQPTMFNFDAVPKFAKGAGLMGEAGPEAIMPLKRTADGRLGISAEGGTGSSIINNISVTVSDGGAMGRATSTGGALGASIAKQMKDTVTAEVTRMLQPGGLLYKSRMA